MPAPKLILDLIERFRANESSYRSGNYNETQLRREFLDPFFKELGWDIDNRAGYAEAYKDVIHEDAIKIGGVTKAPDYCFRVGGARKFFLEAKKPQVNIKDDISPAFQLRRYAWSAKLPLSILSDFEEFAIYDCRTEPVKTDKASTARTFYCRYTEYPDKWDEIAATFSKEAILKGSFDKYAAGKNRKGTQEVDVAFLAEIEGWREMLAKNLAVRNRNLTTRELNFAVQRTIDRIIFLRICEDRGIETYGQLQGLLKSPHVYADLCVLFQRADDRYNSGLFHFHKEKDRHEPPDDLTLKLALDDKPLKDILRKLYYPDSPYEFSVLPADILGQVYEQFLGKVIRLTAGHQAKVEEKPEVRKAGGVFYTPTYIVDYIVKQTVGKLCEGQTPKEVARLRILDPACGSGSFLLGAYQFLLDWHLDWYTQHEPDKYTRGKSPALRQSASGDWQLTTGERKRILLNNLYGVDIDAQAVETTKLSLLLKVLEGETSESLGPRLFQERALPDLGNNIKCGNSLIGSDFYEQGQLAFFDEEERYRINVFDWAAEFAEIMKGGGFDAVIGNPPYGAMITKPEAEYLSSQFIATGKNLDTYSLFMEDAIRLCKSRGRISMIVPTGWYSGAKFSGLRRLIACATDPTSFVNLPYDIFDAWVDTTVFVATKREEIIDWPRSGKHVVTIRTFPKRHRIFGVEEFLEEVSIAEFADWFKDGEDEYLTYADLATTKLLKKVRAVSTPLQELADVQRGVTPFHLADKPMHTTSKIAFEGTVRRYKLDRGETKYIQFDDSLAEFKPERYFVGPRLLLRELISRQFQLQAVKVTENFVTNKSMQSILQLPDAPTLNYLLGIINSRLMSWYFLKRSQVAQRDDFPKIVLKETRALPIRPIDFSNKSDRARHDRMVTLVEQMLQLHRQLLTAKTAHEQTLLERQVKTTDGQIDRLVYELYGLTKEEISIVEAGS